MKKKESKIKRDLNKKNDDMGLEIDVFKFIYIVLGVICVFCLFYLFTLFVLNKDTKVKNDDVETVISLDTTIVGRSLSMPEDNYYVIFYDPKNEEVNEKFSQIIRNYTYSTDDDHTKLYSVDMSSSFNKKYVGEKSNVNPSKVSDISIKGTTLMVVKKGKVVEYIEDETKIEELLK